MTCDSFQGANSSQESSTQGCRYVYELKYTLITGRVLRNNDQPMTTNAQCAESTLFLLFACLLFLFCLIDSLTLVKDV